MMTLRRFRTLADSYGADLQRWPQRLRAPALALLDSSAQARAVMARARELDRTMAAARTVRDARIWGGESADRALRRLHARVSARATPSGPEAVTAARHAAGSRSPRRAGWIGLATAAGLAVVAGLTLGILYSPSAPPEDLTALLQPAPLQVLTD